MKSKHTPEATNKHNPNDQDFGKESKKPQCLCPTLPQALFFFYVVTWTFDKTEVAVIIDAQELHINTCSLEIKQNHTLFLRQRKEKKNRKG